jgi:autotransporter-associated beta strand protein
MKKMRTCLTRAATLAGLCLYAITAQAQFDWTGHAGSGTGNWGDNGSWSHGSHPAGFSDTAVFNAPSRPIATAQSVSLTGGPFPIGIITVNTNVENSLTFTGGALTLGGPAQIDVQTPSPVTFDPTAIISGTAGLNKTGPGTLILSGTNTYTGPTNVNQGTLLVTQPGSLDAGSSVTVAPGATLGGTGIVNGSVNIASGGILAPGIEPVPGTLTVGPLTLNSGSILNYQYGIPTGLNDLVNVMGNLTLAGTLNVTDVGGFGLGVYRVFNYTGSLTNNILHLGSLPSGFNFSVDTSITNQVNLVVSGVSRPTQFWDGINTTPGSIAFGRGGTATWNNVTTNTNWTTQDGTSDAAWGSGFAVFAGTAGTVTLGDNIHFTGMQFLTDGYVIQAPGSDTLLAAPDNCNSGRHRRYSDNLGTDWR